MTAQDFGARLRELRLARGMTKEDFCGGDEILCTRQLTRLETGKSQPKLETLIHLAQRLDITVSELIGETQNKISLPKEYFNLKFQLLHTSTYDSDELLQELEKKVDYIFENFYDDLPDEEQRVIDVIQSEIYTYESKGKQKYGQQLLEDHMPRLCEDRGYNLQDLLFIPLYHISLGDENDIRSQNFNVERFHKISQNLLKSQSNIPFEYLFLLRDALMIIPMVEFKRKEYHYSQRVIKLLKDIMRTTQDYHKKPLVKSLEAQYALLVENDSLKAEAFYNEAIQLSLLLENNFLADRIRQEKQKFLQY